MCPGNTTHRNADTPPYSKREHNKAHSPKSGVKRTRKPYGFDTRAMDFLKKQKGKVPLTQTSLASFLSQEVPICCCIPQFWHKSGNFVLVWHIWETSKGGGQSVMGVGWAQGCEAFVKDLPKTLKRKSASNINHITHCLFKGWSQVLLCSPLAV